MCCDPTTWHDFTNKLLHEYAPKHLPAGKMSHENNGGCSEGRPTKHHVIILIWSCVSGSGIINTVLSKHTASGDCVVGGKCIGNCSLITWTQSAHKARRGCVCERVYSKYAITNDTDRQANNWHDLNSCWAYSRVSLAKMAPREQLVHCLMSHLQATCFCGCVQGCKHFDWKCSGSSLHNRGKEMM